MIQKLLSFALLVGALSLLTSTASAQCPEPTGTVNWVKINGEIVEDLSHEFLEDGTWEMWKGDDLIGWGTWELDEENCTIDYKNESGDGGGGQSGTFTWDAESAEWERTWASHPAAPPMSIVPPL